MFFQVDDQFQVNEKTKTLARKALMGDVRGLAALGVWTVSGSMCQATLTDGVVSIEDIVSITLNHAISLELANLLVAAGLWHETGHECERCPEVKEGTWVFHDWFAMGYDRGYQVKTKREKSKELKDRVLVASVWARDCINPADPNIGHCRYCATTLHKKDTRSADGPQMDHVDPTKAAGVENVALACGPCNRKKAQRTPEAAGMTLLAPPTRNNGAAESPDSPPKPTALADGPVKVETSAETTVETTVKPPPEPQRETILACGGDRAGAGRAGQGRAPEGLTKGSGKATPDGSKPPSKSSRRRRRGKGKNNLSNSQPTTVPSSDQVSAGKAPEARTAGSFGSPWHSWSGPPSNVTETTCTIHNEEQPCRRCMKEGS